MELIGFRAFNSYTKVEQAYIFKCKSFKSSFFVCKLTNSLFEVK